MGSHQAAHPTPPSSVKLCRVLLRRHIQGCATYMNFERVSFYFTIGAILKSCHLSCSFTAKGRNPRKKTHFLSGIAQNGGMEGGGLLTFIITLFLTVNFLQYHCIVYFPGHHSSYFSILCFPFLQVSFPHSLVDAQSW